jgi:DNA-binding PadR family transcriptional regulator
VGRERAIRQGDKHYLITQRGLKTLRELYEMPGLPCSRLLARGGLACYGAANKREETHVAAYSS